jgi:hypothetical protein
MEVVMSDNEFSFVLDESNGMLIGPDGCHYDSKAEAMYYGQTELCGCGNPEAVHDLLVACLKSIDDDRNNGNYGLDGIEEIVRESPAIVAEFIAHFLDQKNLTEHGSSVYGSWLTSRGKQFIKIGFMNEIGDE